MGRDVNDLPILIFFEAVSPLVKLVKQKIHSYGKRPKIRRNLLCGKIYFNSHMKQEDPIINASEARALPDTGTKKTIAAQKLPKSSNLFFISLPKAWPFLKRTKMFLYEFV